MSTVGVPVPQWLEEFVAAAGREQSFFRSFPEPTGKHSAVLMLFGPGEGSGADVVLTQRSARMRKHAGQVSFPGGGIDAGDASPSAAALREAHEEVGLDPATVDVRGQLRAVPLSVTGFRVTPVVAWWHTPGALHAKSTQEVERVVRVPLAELADPGNRHTAVHPGRAFAAPAFEVRGLYVWGFTAILLDATLHLSGWEKDWNREDHRPVPSRFLAR